MARRSDTSSDSIHQIVNDFVQRLVATVEAATTTRIQAAVATAMGAPVRRGPGRPPRNPFALSAMAPARAARPKQLCPVPGCKNPAAPVFGMVCADHKDVPKAKIKQYREARRQAKTTGGAAKSARGGAKATRRGRPRKAKRAGRPPKRAARQTSGAQATEAAAA